MQNLLRAAANALANLAEKAHQWADWAEGLDPGGPAHEFAGVDIVGIDFSTSIRKVASHVIRGWERYRRQAEALGGDRGVWAFGVNATPFPLTGGPVPPRRLPSFCEEHFGRRGCGRGLIEYGSAFYDYFLVALGYAQELGAFDEGRRAPVPISISLLCDSWPNGGAYRAGDVQPLLEAARARGVRFRLVGFALRKYRAWMQQFPDSLGLTSEEQEFAWYDEGLPDEQTISNSFDRLAGIGDPSPLSDRRATERYHCAPATLVRLQVPPKQEIQQGWLLDGSLGGVGMLLARPQEPGLAVVIRLSTMAGAKVYELPARVIHATAYSGGDWVVGCRLDTPLTQDDLDAVLGMS
jgi:hypothetical protein